MNSAHEELRVFHYVICFEEVMDEVIMNWLTTVPELLHHCLDLGVEGLDVILLLHSLLVQVLKVTVDQDYNRRCANLTFLEDPE